MRSSRVMVLCSGQQGEDGQAGSKHEKLLAGKSEQSGDAKVHKSSDDNYVD